MLQTNFGCFLLFCSVLAVFLFCALSYTLFFGTRGGSSDPPREQGSSRSRQVTEGAAIPG